MIEQARPGRIPFVGVSSLGIGIEITGADIKGHVSPDRMVIANLQAVRNRIEAIGAAGASVLRERFILGLGFVLKR